MIETITAINREVAQELSISEEIVRKVNSFYWKYGIKQAISSGEYPSVRVKNIGTFATSRLKVNLRILRLIKEIRYFKASTKEFVKMTREEYIEARLGELRLLLARRNEIARAYKHNQEKQKQRKHENTQFESDMDE